MSLSLLAVVLRANKDHRDESWAWRGLSERSEEGWRGRRRRGGARKKRKEEEKAGLHRAKV